MIKWPNFEERTRSSSCLFPPRHHRRHRPPLRKTRGILRSRIQLKPHFCLVCLVAHLLTLRGGHRLTADQLFKYGSIYFLNLLDFYRASLTVGASLTDWCSGHPCCCFWRQSDLNIRVRTLQMASYCSHQLTYLICCWSVSYFLPSLVPWLLPLGTCPEFPRAFDPSISAGIFHKAQ